jgi:tetratricopeptide (TPR) repeat protein
MLRIPRLLLAVPVLLLVSDLLGQEPAGKSYPLAIPPLKIHDGLADLKMGTVPPLSPEERALLEKIWALRVEQKSPFAIPLLAAERTILEKVLNLSVEKKFALAPADDALLVDALLYACGIEPGKQKDYRDRLDALTTAAKEASAAGKTPAERAELLLQHLHKTAFKGGYAAEQSLLTGSLDTGKYNCVSSAALYYLLGSRLGLPLRAVAIPGGPFLAGHATVDLVEGDKRIQVETTNPNGFDWEKKVKQPGVVVIGIVPERKNAVDLDGLGLAAMTYTNRAVALTKEKTPQRLAAAHCDLIALSLYPTSETAANNTVANFSNWGLALTAEGKHEDALRVFAFAQSFAPKSRELANNYAVGWEQYILSQLRAGKDKEAVEIVHRAAKALPRDTDFSHESDWFARLGEEKLKKEEWEPALAVVERGLAVLPDREKEKLKDWRSGAYRQWSQALLEKKDYNGSIKVLAQAYKLNPKDTAILEGIEYHTQEALKLAEAKDGLKEARAHYAAIKEQFPTATGVAEVAGAFARRKVSALAKENKFADALKLADELTPGLLDATERAEAGATIYDTWAQSLVPMGKLEAVLDKYAEALKLYPKNDRLINNSLATIDTFANPAINAAKWDDAIAVYKVGLKYFPENDHLKNNLAFCERKKGKK